jgi:hypothetical protein
MIESSKPQPGAASQNKGQPRRRSHLSKEVPATPQSAAADATMTDDQPLETPDKATEAEGRATTVIGFRDNTVRKSVSFAAAAAGKSAAAAASAAASAPASAAATAPAALALHSIDEATAEAEHEDMFDGEQEHEGEQDDSFEMVTQGKGKKRRLDDNATAPASPFGSGKGRRVGGPAARVRAPLSPVSPIADVAPVVAKPASGPSGSNGATTFVLPPGSTSLFTWNNAAKKTLPQPPVLVPNAASASLAAAVSATELEAQLTANAVASASAAAAPAPKPFAWATRVSGSAASTISRANSDGSAVSGASASSVGDEESEDGASALDASMSSKAANAVEELTADRLEKRQRQIEIGYKTPEYKRYIELVPKDKRVFRKKTHCVVSRASCCCVAPSSCCPAALSPFRASYSLALHYRTPGAYHLCASTPSFADPRPQPGLLQARLGRPDQRVAPRPSRLGRQARRPCRRRRSLRR